MSDTGGKVVQDGRVTSAQNWVLGTVGTLLVALIGWCAVQLIGLRESVAVMTAEIRAERQTNADTFARMELRDERQDMDIRDLQRDVSTLEGRTLRGHKP